MLLIDTNSISINPLALILLLHTLIPNTQPRMIPKIRHENPVPMTAPMFNFDAEWCVDMCVNTLMVVPGRVKVVGD